MSLRRGFPDGGTQRHHPAADSGRTRKFGGSAAKFPDFKEQVIAHLQSEQHGASLGHAFLVLADPGLRVPTPDSDFYNVYMRWKDQRFDPYADPDFNDEVQTLPGELKELKVSPVAKAEVATSKPDAQKAKIVNKLARLLNYIHANWLTDKLKNDLALRMPNRHPGDGILAWRTLESLMNGDEPSALGKTFRAFIALTTKPGPPAHPEAYIQSFRQHANSLKRWSVLHLTKHQDTLVEQFFMGFL